MPGQVLLLFVVSSFSCRRQSDHHTGDHYHSGDGAEEQRLIVVVAHEQIRGDVEVGDLLRLLVAGGVGAEIFT